MDEHRLVTVQAARHFNPVVPIKAERRVEEDGS
jgi:hypothetical protein